MKVNNLKINDRELLFYFVIISVIFFIFARLVWSYSEIVSAIFIGGGVINGVAGLRLSLILLGAADSPDNIEKHQNDIAD